MVPNNSALVCFQVYRKLNESLDINTNSAVGGTNSQQMALLSKAKTSISQALDRLESENNEVLFDYTIVLFQDCLFNPFPNKPWVLHVCSTKLLVKSNFSFSHSVFYSLGELSAIFIRPSKTGRIMGSPMAGGRASGWEASTSLSGEYLQNYSSYGYKISWVDRSHQEGVQCAGIITLASLMFQLLPFVVFHT